MPAIHKLKFKNHVLTFQDADILDQLVDQGMELSDIGHDSFMQGAFLAASNSNVVLDLSDEEVMELMMGDPNEIAKGFEFAPTSLVQEVYGL